MAATTVCFAQGKKGSYPTRAATALEAPARRGMIRCLSPRVHEARGGRGARCSAREDDREAATIAIPMRTAGLYTRAAVEKHRASERRCAGEFAGAMLEGGAGPKGQLRYARTSLAGLPANGVSAFARGATRAEETTRPSPRPEPRRSWRRTVAIASACARA